MNEWMLHYPSDWTQAQGTAYARHVLIQLNSAFVPVVQALGCRTASGILLTCVTGIAKANPVYHEDIKNVMANVYDMIDQMDPLNGSKVTKQ